MALSGAHTIGQSRSVAPTVSIRQGACLNLSNFCVDGLCCKIVMPPEEAWQQPLDHHVELLEVPHAGDLPGTLTHEGRPEAVHAAIHYAVAHNKHAYDTG